MRADGLRRRIVWAVLGVALLAGCSAVDIPPAVGSSVSAVGLQATVPEGWSIRTAPRTIELTRQRPYAGGFPTLTLRALDPDEARLLPEEGRAWSRDGWTIHHRYRRWRGPRSQGYRLEGVARRDGLVLQFDGATWDDAAEIDHRYFEQEVWPIVLSARPR